MHMNSNISHIEVWLLSNLVEESLVNSQRKVLYVMKAIGLTLNDLDFVITPFSLPVAIVE